MSIAIPPLKNPSSTLLISDSQENQDKIVMDKFRESLKTELSSNSLEAQGNALNALRNKTQALPKRKEAIPQYGESTYCSIIFAVAFVPIVGLGTYLLSNK